MRGNNDISKVKHEIDYVLDCELENIGKFCMELAEGKITPT
jgi:hypothetical protein